MQEKIIGSSEIRQRLPLAPPYLMVDRAVVSADGRTARGVKAVSGDEEFFVGHFPARAIMPGVLQVEAMLQLGCLALTTRFEHPFLRHASRIKFRRPVVPGDVLEIAADVSEVKDHAVTITATTSVAGQLASEAVLTLDLARPETDFLPSALTLPPKLAPPDPAAVQDIEYVRRVIPHRFPFQLIDRVLHSHLGAEGTGEIIGLKNVSSNDPYFSGLTSTHPWLPNTLQMEIAAQLGCALILQSPQYQGCLGLFMGVDQAEFRRPVIPGDSLLVRVQAAMVKSSFGKCAADLFVGDAQVSRVEFKFAITRPAA